MVCLVKEGGCSHSLAGFEGCMVCPGKEGGCGHTVTGFEGCMVFPEKKGGCGPETTEPTEPTYQCVQKERAQKEG